MITIDELKTLEEAFSIVRSYLNINREVMTEDGVNDTTNTLRNLNMMISSYKHEEYLKQLKDFRDHMEATLDKYLGSTDELFEEFCDLKFEITYNGKSVYLMQGATVFDGISRVIDDEITEQSC